MIIRLQDIEMQAYHGVFPEEKTKGNIFRVNITLEVADAPGIETDKIEDTVNYQLLYDIVQHEMTIPSDLLEHVAGRIRDAIIRIFPKCKLTVAISKKNPPLGGQVAWATVELTNQRHGRI